MADLRLSGMGGIPFGDTASRPSNAATGQPYFNGEVGRLELYSSNGWQNIVQETPGVASLSGAYNQSNGTGTFVVSGTNFVDGAIAYAVGTNAVEYQATSTTYNSLVQLSVVFSNLDIAYEPYDLKVVNPSNLFGFLPDAFYINDNPVWSTAAGSLGTLQNGSVSIQLSATDDESNTLSYTVSSGSLPTGLSLSSTGLLSGTMSANAGTYSFNVSVSDGTNTPVSRSFAITVPAPVVTGGTLTSDSTYYYRTFNSNDTLAVSNNILIADFMIIGGGGGGGWNNAGGGGAGGYIETLSYALPSGSHAVTIGSGGAAFSNNNSSVGPAGSGVDTTLGSIFTAKGGGGGNSWTSQASAAAGGSGGGSSGNPTGIYAGGAATQTSQAGVSGSSGFGYAGGSGGSAQGGSDVGGGGGGGAGGVGQLCRGFGYSDYIGSGAPGGHGGLGKVSALDGVTRAGGGGGGSGGNGTGSYWSGEVNGGTGGGGPSAAWSTSNTREVGLAGAGNGGSAVRNKAGGHATSNTGSGGGGGDNTDGGNGGSGVVVVRYTKARVGG